MFVWLDKAYEERPMGLVFHSAPEWEPFRSDPRFIAFRKKLGLARRGLHSRRVHRTGLGASEWLHSHDLDPRISPNRRSQSSRFGTLNIHANGNATAAATADIMNAFRYPPIAAWR